MLSVLSASFYFLLCLAFSCLHDVLDLCPPCLINILPLPFGYQPSHISLLTLNPLPHPYIDSSFVRKTSISLALAIMKNFVTVATLAAGANALVGRGSNCCFHIDASGGAKGTLGQLDDGQNRIGGGLGEAQYCIDSKGAITDANGRGCILTRTFAPYARLVVNSY